MSIDIINRVFQTLDCVSNWSLQLLNVKTSKRAGIGYSSRHIDIAPQGRLDTLIKDISDVYTGSGKKAIVTYRNVREYDGTADALTIYKLSSTHELISTEYARFIRAIAEPNNEDDPFEYKSAYLLKGKLEIDDENIPIKLITMQNPITTLKHKFYDDNGTFRELSDRVLSLRPTTDVLIVGGTVYLLTLAGENLFNMARSYKAVCHKKVEEIVQANIISNMESFKCIAESGHNPRKFIAFNEARLLALKKRSIRLEMAKRFSIPLDATQDKFDTSVIGTTEKIVKLLCNKGMLDPFEKTAVEVDGARKWQ